LNWRGTDALSPEFRPGGRKEIKKSASAKVLTGVMRMPFCQSPALAKGNESRKVHPQSGGLAGCGCANPEKQSSQGSKERKKCIRKGKKAAMRMPKIQKPPPTMEKSKKKGIRICRYLQMRMPNHLAASRLQHTSRD